MSFFTVCAWVSLVVSILRVCGTIYAVLKAIPLDVPLTQAQNDKVSEVVYKATKWPITIILVSVLWLYFGE